MKRIAEATFTTSKSSRSGRTVSDRSAITSAALWQA
jgi:hypothetical protein